MNSKRRDLIGELLHGKLKGDVAAPATRTRLAGGLVRMVHVVARAVRQLSCRLDPRIRPESRANEVASLRLRLVSEPSSGQAPAQEVELALSLMSKRRRMLALIGDVEACCVCGKGYPPPNGRWDGGYCCGGTTENLFRQDELACLRASGTTPANLKPPREDHAGCAFRGERGCSLEPEHRPNLCVRYACKMLWEEYERRGIEVEVRALASAMQREFHEYQKLRSDRLWPC